jgi:tetratricopeptide (TPR) repeat protein
LFAGSISAQKEERDFIRKGNRAFNDSVFVDAEVNYRKALEVNPQSAVSMYNLGNTLSQQQKFKDAMEQYMMAANIEKDKMKLAQIYHNAGVIFQATQNYAQAIEAYKKALRNNPKDDETRYNLALAQKLLKQQEQNQQNKDQQDQQNQKDEQIQEQEQNQDQNQEQNQQDSKPEKNEMSKENAEQMLNAVMQEEKEVQEKVKKQQQIIQSGRLDKDW